MRVNFDHNLYLSNGKTWIHLSLPTPSWPPFDHFFSNADLPKIDAVELRKTIDKVAVGIPDPEHPYLRCEGDTIRTLDGSTSAEIQSLKSTTDGTFGSFL